MITTMNQIQKRLSIINNAISITDTDTIQLQLLKLLKFRKTDADVEEIIDTLTSENFVKAQRLIQHYLHATSQSTIQESEMLIDPFDLFDTDIEAPQETIDINDFFLEGTVHENEFETQPDPFFEIDNETTSPQETIPIDLDTFFAPKRKQIKKEIKHDETPPTLIVNNYPKIPQISKKLLYMNQLYTPSVYDEDEIYDSVEAMLDKIAMEGYSENDIEEALRDVEALTLSNDIAQAAQLLLVCASSESKFGQFMLGRALYQGILLQKNVDASFELMHNLALNRYPEALCDLGQFYEYGIGTKKNLKEAKRCYKEAMDLGIQRAQTHYHHLKKHFFLF